MWKGKLESNFDMAQVWQFFHMAYISKTIDYSIGGEHNILRIRKDGSMLFKNFNSNSLYFSLPSNVYRHCGQVNILLISSYIL